MEIKFTIDTTTANRDNLMSELKSDEDLSNIATDKLFSDYAISILNSNIEFDEIDAVITNIEVVGDLNEVV